MAASLQGSGHPTDASSLIPYVPELVLRWLRDRPQQRYSALDGTLVFADITGFTRMTELLAARGRIGAEEMADLINRTFDPLLAAAYAYGPELIKWGGDATLLLFHGDDHAPRACRAALQMQRALRGLGPLPTSRGSLALRMSIGIHSGRCDFFLVGSERHRELIVAGPAATVLSAIEKAAGPGQVLVSEATASALAASGERRPTTRLHDGWLLTRAPHVAPLATVPVRSLDAAASAAAGIALDPVLCEQVLAGGLDSEHRDATIGFVRCSGVDQLLGSDGPGAVQDALDQLLVSIQTAAAAHSVTFLASDAAPDGAKVMLAAGVPMRIGHDADRMLAAVRAMLARAGRLPLHAGVTTGRVFAADFGPSYRRTYSLMGDPVNLAARLMQHADPGELLVSADVLHASSRRVAAVPRAPFAVRGKRAPVRAFAIPSAADADVTPATYVRDAPPSVPLIGREDELTALVTAIDTAAAGAGLAVELVGEPGMGKSRLLAEFAVQAGADVLWADGDVYAAARPYAPFERLLRERWGVTDASQPQPQPQELTERLTATTAAHAPELVPWLPLIGIVAGLELPLTPVVEQTDASARKERLEELTSDLLAAILAPPTAFVFNDVHLMDEASRDLISRLAADAPRRGWVVIASRRPDSASPLRREPQQRVELAPLAPAAAAELLRRATAGTAVPVHRLQALAERAAGNPLFLSELAAQLSEGGDPDELPRSIEGAIAARIDRLRTGDRRLLRCAAVLGIDVDGDLLDEVLDDREVTAAPARLHELDEFVEAITRRRWRFSHQLVREVAYEGLPYRRRRELHARTATAIERSSDGRPEQQAELLSVHLLAGGRFEAAWRYSCLAAQRARGRYANAAAADSYRRALAAATYISGLGPEELAAVDEALGEICIELGELGEADAALRRALRRLRADPLARARLELQVARLRDIAGRHAIALRWVQRAQRSLEGDDGPGARRLRAQLEVRRARISYRLGRHADGCASAERAAALARAAGDRTVLAEALEYGDLCAVELGRPAGAGAWQALAIYEELGDVGSEARVRNTLGLLAYHRGEWPEALAQYEAAELAYARAGTRWDAATAVANAAEILADQGRLDDAEGGLRRAIEVWSGAGAASEVAFGEYQLGRIAARRGDTDGAMALFASARAQLLDVGELSEVVVVDALTAECRLLAGEPAQALRRADATLARAASLGGSSAAPLLHRVRARALLALGDRAGAQDALHRALAAAREREAGHEVAFALGALLDADLAASRADRAAWSAERDELVAALGLES